MSGKIPHTAIIILSAAIMALTAGCQQNDPAILEKAGSFYNECMNSLDEKASMSNKLAYLYNSSKAGRDATLLKESFAEAIARAHQRYEVKPEPGFINPEYDEIRKRWHELLDEVLDDEALNSIDCPYSRNRPAKS